MTICQAVERLDRRSVAAGDVWAIDRMLILDGRAQRKACAEARDGM